MASNHKFLLATHGEKMVEIYDALGKQLGQHDVSGTLYWGGACVQGSIAAMAVQPNGVHLMNVKTLQIFFKFRLPDGGNARIALSKDTLTLGVGSDTGVFVMMMMMMMMMRW